MQKVRKDTARRTTGVDIPPKSSPVPRVRRLYHVVRDSWIFCTLLALFGAIVIQSCAAKTASDPLHARGEHMWTKARVDLLVAESRERVLLARYAELQNDTERAARYYHEAWCVDPHAPWLQQKREHFMEQGLLSEHARCYAHPSSL